MTHNLETALDQCLLLMRGGMTVEQCLTRYPEHAAELRPLLEMALSVARVPTPAPSSAARVAAEQRMLEALAHKQQTLSRQSPLVRRIRGILSNVTSGAPQALRPAWQVALLGLFVAIVVAAAGGLTVAASGGSIPGDTLYPVKLASQRVQLALTVNAGQQQLLADQFATQRRLDVQAALGIGQQATVAFEGVLQEMDPDQWWVGGVPVQISAATDIVGEPYLGAIVEVEGDLPGTGQLLAITLTVHSETVPWQAPTATYTASPAPTPTSTPSPTPGLTPTPTATSTATPTDTAEPTATFMPTRTPVPSTTAQATTTPEPPETGEPEETEEPHETPEHEGTDEATSSPEPHETEEHEHTPEPSRTPEIDGTPTPTEEPDD
jgi:hypothetical protein